MGRAEGRNNNRRTRGTAAAAALSRARTRDFQSSPPLPLPPLPSPLAAHQRSCQPNGLQSGSGLWGCPPTNGRGSVGTLSWLTATQPRSASTWATRNCNAVTATTATEGRCLPRPEHESGETWLALVMMMMAVFSEQQQGEEVKRGRIAGRE